MPLDPSIALGVRPIQIPQQPDIVNQLAQVYGLQNAMQGSQMNQMKMAEYQRNMNQLDILRKSPAPAGVDPIHWSTDPMGALKSAKEQVDIRKTVSETGKSDAETQLSKLKLLNEKLRSVDATDSASISRVLGTSVALGFHTMEEAQAETQRILAMPIQDRKQYLAKQGANASEAASMLEQHFGSTGGMTNIPMNKFTGVASGPGMPSTMTADQIAMLPIHQGTLDVARGNLSATQNRAAWEGIPVSSGGGAIQPTQQQGAIQPTAQAATSSTVPVKVIPQASLLPVKELQKREAIYPQATLAKETTEQSIDKLIGNLTSLKNHKGLSGITGLVYGRTPNLTGPARDAQALLDNIMSSGQISVMQALKQASATGSTGFGQLSEKEGEVLRNSLAAINQVQNTNDFQKGIDGWIEQLRQTKGNVQNAYKAEYSYKGAYKDESSYKGKWTDL